MRDEMDARLWNAHHDKLSEWIDGVGGSARRALRRSRAARPARDALLAGFAAIALTLLSFGVTAAGPEALETREKAPWLA